MDQAVTQFSAHMILVITDDTEGHKVLFEIKQPANVNMQYIHKKKNFKKPRRDHSMYVCVSKTPPSCI